MLGAALLHPDIVDDVALALPVGDVYYAAHRAVFETILSLRDEGQPTGAAEVADRLHRAGRLEDIGGYRYLGDVMDEAGAGSGWERAAAMVREDAARRRLINYAAWVRAEAAARQMPAADLIAAAEQQVFDLGADASKQRSGVPVSLAASEAEVAKVVVERAAGRAPPARFVRSGFTALDQLIGGWRPGRLYIIAARPSIGKSAFAAAVAANAAEAGHVTQVFSLEMAVDELTERSLAAKSQVILDKVSGTLPITPEEAARVAAAAARRYPGDVKIDDSADQSVARIAAAVRRAARVNNAALVVIDYLQLIEPENDRDPRHQQVGRDSRKLKQLAKRCDIPVIVCCQLNRQVEGREEGQPRLSDLRDSGEIEQNADAVLMLYRNKDATPSDTVQHIECLVAKQRGGPTGKFSLNYMRPIVKFQDRLPLM